MKHAKSALVSVREQAKALVARMTREEKAALCGGQDFWHTHGVERLGLEPIMVTDGPHGLRKQAADADHLGLNQSVPATCFPPRLCHGLQLRPGPDGAARHRHGRRMPSGTGQRSSRPRRQHQAQSSLRPEL